MTDYDDWDGIVHRRFSLVSLSYTLSLCVRQGYHVGEVMVFVKCCILDKASIWMGCHFYRAFTFLSARQASHLSVLTRTWQASASFWRHGHDHLRVSLDREQKGGQDILRN
jgi:hypothetical protein